MDRNPRGLCMIINNVDFEGSDEPRLGSDKDTGKLEHLFNELHFQVEVRKNLTASDMLDWFKRVSLLSHSDYDCFACCIMTHGALGTVSGTDNKLLQIQQILGLFTGTSCESLINKPKLFFIQACQGSSHQEGVQVRTDSGPCGIGVGIPTTIPNEADFLLSYSTVAGYVSYRDSAQGSWYVNALVDELSNDHNNTHIMDILTRVNNKVSVMNAHTEYGIKKQVPAPTHTLTKAVYLRSLVQ
ncbi:caspase-8-like [Patiria miniata]|uniref:Caspase-8 n=1 Tax=Patiria miniata TaxID=46514 RepID=A0A914AGQ4_PATMI|nr:caspase-8-like [Patiria miniata]